MPTVTFRSPRDHAGIYVKVEVPTNFDQTQFRRVDTLAKQVYEIANGTGPATFSNFPIDDTSLVAVMLAQKCCLDGDEWKRVTDMGRAVLYLHWPDAHIALNDACMKFIKEKKTMN
jgi:hypothetical protein